MYGSTAHLTLSRLEAPYDGLNDKSLNHELHVFAFPDPNSVVTSEYFLKYSNGLLFLCQVKERHPFTTEEDIARRS